MRVAFLLLVTLSFSVLATDAVREQRWIEQTVDHIFDGEPVFLNTPNHRFFGIYTESESESRNGLIVLHGTGFHPNYEQVVRPLRVALTGYGWHTLSIQLPLLDHEANYNDYESVYPEVPPRIHSAIEFLRQKGIANIGIVAHSQGATMASYFTARYPDEISSMVLIGMSAQHSNKDINSAESLKKIAIPVLDIFGSKDFPAVLQTVELRREAAAHNPDYEQQVIDGAYHFFEIREDKLIDALSSWLTPHLK